MHKRSVKNSIRLISVHKCIKSSGRAACAGAGAPRSHTTLSAIDHPAPAPLPTP